MNVLIVASTFPAHERDSVPAFVRDQIVAMKRADTSLQFTVLAPHDARSNTKPFMAHEHYDEYRFHYARPDKIERLAGRGIMPALQANPLNYLLIPALFIGEFVALYRLTKKIKPDLLYAHWFTPQAINARLVGRLTGTPFVFTTHASDISVWKKIPLIGSLVVRSNVRRARAFTAVSRRSMEKLAQFFSDAEWRELRNRRHTIPMGVDLHEGTYGDTGTASQSILFIGRLAEKKGVHHLLPAYKDLLLSAPDATLTIVGDGPWLEKLKHQARVLGVDRSVTFPGYVNGGEKSKLIESHAVYAVPSIVTDSGDAEGLPVSLMEGMTYGKLCVATNESGADDIITDGVDGFLVSQKDEVALTGALKRALELSTDERRLMGERARETAKQFAWPTIAEQHISLLLKGSI